MANLFSAVENLTFGETLIILLMGMLIIMLVLTVLVGLLYVIRYAVGAIDKAGDKKEPSPTKTEAPISIPSDEDEELVAAITAAITCVMAQESKSEVVAPFVIKKIKHIH